MSTLREILQTEIADLQTSLQAEIADLQTQLVTKQAQLNAFEGSAAAFLDKEATTVREFVLGLWGHIFGSTPAPTDPVDVVEVSAPAVAAPEQTGVTQ